MTVLTDSEIIAIRDELLPSQGESFDCIAFARAILAYALPWRPIASAPTDQAEVIVYAPSETPSVFAAMCIMDDWSRSAGGRYAPEDDFFGDPPFAPTHWMPLPLHPTDAKE